MASISKAELAAIDCCPDAALQRERRRLRERKAELSRRIVEAENAVESQRRNVSSTGHRLKAMAKGSDEYARTEQRMKYEAERLDDAIDRRDELIAERDQLERDREALKLRMLSLEV